MPPSKVRSSEIASRRKIANTKEKWTEIFQDAVMAMLNTDSEKVKELTDREAEEVVRSAGKIADKALEAIEERFPEL